MTRYSKPNVPFIEASKKGGKNRPTLIVLSSSFTTSDSGAALGIAKYWYTNHAQESHHYIVDEAAVYRCVDDSRLAVFSKNSTQNALSVHLCDDPSGTIERWDDAAHTKLLSNAADLVAGLCLFHGIRPRYLSDLELKKWRKWRLKRRGGIVVQGFMAQGYWPEDYFLTLIEAHIQKHKFANKK